MKLTKNIIEELKIKIHQMTGLKRTSIEISQDNKISLSLDISVINNEEGLAELINEATGLSWKLEDNIFVLEAGAIEYSCMDYENVYAYYIYDKAIGEFEYAGTYLDTGECVTHSEEWEDHGEDYPHEFCMPPDYLKTESSFESPCVLCIHNDVKMEILQEFHKWYLEKKYPENTINIAYDSFVKGMDYINDRLERLMSKPIKIRDKK